ncbi:C1 family peptidase [Microcoleus sp.]|uniref:C1 family peptidase n=1 Tax=Microcoleus sp. TaxID=44472 RepID=UPI00403E43ED
METQGTAKNQGKDWRKKGLGWIPDYPDERDYFLDSEEVQKSGNLRRNEVTKSIEDIAENLIEVIESLQNGFPRNQELKKIKTGLESKVFGKASFYKVKVYTKSLRLGIQPSPMVRQLKYYFQLLSSHPQLSECFQPINFFPDHQTYWEWLASENFNEETEKIVKKFQKQVKIREDGIVGIETYTAINNYIGDIKYSQPDKNTPLVNLLPIPIWIQEDTFQIIFDTLKSWWINFNEDPKETVEIALAGLLEPENQKPQTKFPCKFFEMFQKEFYVVEPLVSVIAGMMSPFAIHNDLNSALIKELNKFEKFDKELENSSVKGAILKVADRLNTELEEREEQDNSDPEKPNIITFYKFIHVIVKGYIDKYNLSGDQELSNSFSPSYLFEIIEQENREVSAPTKGKNIIPVTILNLLVNRNWLEKPQAVKARKPYAILPSLVDLTSWCSPIRDQGSINSCTAFAAAALLEYFARKARDEYTCVSPLFLYKVARNLMNSTGDVGASVRETMKTMVAFGVPPEKYWSYEEDKFDEEPPAFCYSYAQSYKTLKYFCLDRPNFTKEILLFQIQAVLAADFPCIFGFTVYGSIYNEENVSSGCIPYPGKGDQVIGGHTVLAVGYDNYKEIKHSDGKGKSRGALLIRNSWGIEWGKKGYGWLPYDYILNGLTADWWSLIKAEWFEAGNFGLGAYAPGDVEGQRVPPPPKDP